MNNSPKLDARKNLNGLIADLALKKYRVRQDPREVTDDFVHTVWARSESQCVRIVRRYFEVLGTILIYGHNQWEGRNTTGPAPAVYEPVDGVSNNGDDDDGL